MEKNWVSALTAQATAAKTLIDTITVPQGVTKLVEVGTILSALGVTTLFSYDHILELECDDATMMGGTQQFAFPGAAILGTDLAPILGGKICDCDVPVTPGSHIKLSTTFGNSATIKPSVRVFGKFV
jgi:hypothetical protein